MLFRSTTLMSRVVVGVLASAFSVTAFASDCEEGTSASDVADKLDQAQFQYGELDIEGFNGTMDAAVNSLACLHEPVTRQLAANLHRNLGLQAFLNRDPNTATRAFAAARSIEPAYTFPSSLIPEGHPLLQDYTAIDPGSGKTEKTPALSESYLSFDGRAAETRPMSFPTVAQLVGDDGAVISTVYLMPDVALDIPKKYLSSTKPITKVEPIVPEKDPVTTEPTGDETVKKPKREKKPLGKKMKVVLPLAIAGGTLVAFSGAAFGVSIDRCQRYDIWSNPTDALERWGTDVEGEVTDQKHRLYDLNTADGAELYGIHLDELKRQTNGWFYASLATGITGLGLGTSAVFVWKF